MHFLDILDFLVEEDDRDYCVPLEFTPAKLTSQATLQALDQIEERNIPLLGFPMTLRRPVQESIRLFWDHPEADVASRPMHDFYTMEEVQIEVANEEPNPTTAISEQQDLEFMTEQEPESTTEHDSNASDVSTASPGHDDNGTTSSSSTIATTEDEARTQQQSQGLVSGLINPPVGDRAEGKQALSRALRSIRQRRPEEYRECIHGMLKRGERVKKVWRILSLTKDGNTRAV